MQSLQSGTELIDEIYEVTARQGNTVAASLVCQADWVWSTVKALTGATNCQEAAKTEWTLVSKTEFEAAKRSGEIQN